MPAVAIRYCFVSVSVPLIGPKQVVPEYGMAIVVGVLSVAVPFSVNGQAGSPGSVA